jgi:hypothetical protein
MSSVREQEQEEGIQIPRNNNKQALSGNKREIDPLSPSL